MVVALFDPGAADEPRTRPLAGHSLAVYEPDARLSLVWPVPEDDEHLRTRSDDGWQPEWAEQDVHDWKRARPGFAVALLSGAPIWQERLWYLDWGSGIGGYVTDFSPRFGEHDETLGAHEIEGWDATAWSVGLAALINSFSHTAAEFRNVDPTGRLVPSPSSNHPIDVARGR